MRNTWAKFKNVLLNREDGCLEIESINKNNLRKFISLLQVIMGLLKFWPKVHSPKEVSLIAYSLRCTVVYTTACTVLVNTLLLGLIAKTGKS